MKKLNRIQKEFRALTEKGVIRASDDTIRADEGIVRAGEDTTRAGQDFYCLLTF